MKDCLGSFHSASGANGITQQREKISLARGMLLRRRKKLDAHTRWFATLGCREVTSQALPQQDICTSRRALLSEVKACRSSRNLERGRNAHRQARESASDSDVYVAAALVSMYAKCGSMAEARQVFDSMKRPDLVSWTALILGYAENGEGAVALDLFARMRFQGFLPDSVTFVAALKACTAIAAEQDEQGKAECKAWARRLHSEIGGHLNGYVQTALLDMYAKCGSMVDARQAFDSMKHPDVVAWNALILGYAENGEGTTALDLFARMKVQGISRNYVTFIAALKACISLEHDGRGKAECLERGKQVHSEIDCYSEKVQCTLICMYAKFGCMVDAQQAFNSMKHPDVVAWNALISGYAENGERLKSWDLFTRMRFQGCQPDSVTILAALKVCTSLALDQDGSGRMEWLERGKQIHSDIGFHSNSYVQTSLIDLYAKCGSMADAQQVFDKMRHPTVASWNSLVLGYAGNGDEVTALDMFSRMKAQGCAPNFVTYLAALKACGSLGALESGSKIHAEIDPGSEDNALLVTSLVDFYGKCGSLVEAQRVFDLHPGTRDLISWNALLAGYSRVGDAEVVFRLFEGLQDAGFRPNDVTFLCVLACCSHAGLVERADEFFKLMSSTYGIAPIAEHYTCMVDLLGRLNKLDDAMVLLRDMPFKADAVTWITVLGACHKWKNAGIGRLSFRSLVSLDDCNPTAYVLMAHIFGSKSMWVEQEMVLGMKKMFEAWKAPGQSCWTNEIGEVHVFSS